jgi:hypothetical protein
MHGSSPSATGRSSIIPDRPLSGFADPQGRDLDLARASKDALGGRDRQAGADDLDHHLDR